MKRARWERRIIRADKQEQAAIAAIPAAASYQDAFNAEPETELDVARAMREGKISSPQTYANVTLFDLRISGTGVSYRKSHKEFVFRSPDIYLTDEFLARCYGLPVIFEHPQKQALDSKEFSDRIVGTILLPYVKGTEVWGIAKIYDESAVQLMTARQMSTSPSVVFRDPEENEQIDLEDGKHLLIEGNPSLLDHLAIVDVGVWDKGGEPSGVKSSVHAEMAETSRADSADQPDSFKGESIMAEVTSTEPVVKKDEGEAGGMGEVLALLKAISGRLDALEQVEAAEAAPAAAPDAAPSLPTPEQKPAVAPVADNAVPSPEVAAMEKRVDALEAKTAPVPETEAAQMADCQAKADSAYAAHGGHAPRPMLGESGMDYRKRLVAGLQKHSKKGAEIKLSAIADSAMMEMVEGIVYADALEAANQVQAVPVGNLLRKTRTGYGNIQIHEYVGDPSVWLNQFSAPAMRHVKH